MEPIFRVSQNLYEPRVLVGISRPSLFAETFHSAT